MSCSKAAYMRQYYIDHKEEYHERYKKYRKDPKFVEKRQNYSRERYHENPEEYKKYSKEYRAKNKESISKQTKLYYEKNREIHNKKQREYYQKNKVRLAEYRFMRRYIDVMSDFILSLEEF